MVLRSVVNQSASNYLRQKVWEPIGAEADAAWLTDAEGFELAHFGFNAVLRDYPRLGRLLAHDGAWEGADHPCAVDDRRHDRKAYRLLPRTGQIHAGFRLWLSFVAAAGATATIRACRRPGPARLHRSCLKARYGSDRS